MYDMLKDKVAIITGAGSGIGKSTANLFLQEGANVGLIDIDHESLQQFKDEADDSDKVRFRTTDVRDASMLKRAIDELVESFGGLDIVIINAGINGRVAPIEDLEEEDWYKTMETNFKSTFLTLKYCTPYLKKQGGSVVITSSINGTRQFGNIGMSLYASSKAAQLAFGKMAALELSTYHIRVNVICPGYVKTNIQENTDSEHGLLSKVEIPVEYPEGDQPLENDGAEAKDVGDLILFLASDRSKHITGTEVYIDGGSTLL
jgi:NAD(P)-dependent dehydrogenase (short-subunit alcohol dehydrogenase family)